MSEYTSPPSIVDTIRDLDERIADIVIGPAPAWQFPTLLNGWVNVGSGLAPASYVRDGLGFVHLRGSIKLGSPAVAVFILAAGFRPGLTEQFSMQDGAGVIRLVEVKPSGEVVFPEAINAATCRLAGITFLAER